MATTTTTTTFCFHSLPLIITIILLLLFSYLPFHLEGLTSTSTITTQEPLNISSTLVDLILRDYTLNTFNNNQQIKTGSLQHIHLPSNFSGVKLDAVRFRCGSLRRYGAQIQEFHIGVGAILEPCDERLVVVKQILGPNWSNVYYKNYDLFGYKLVSPVLGLLAYNARNDKSSSSYQVNLFLDGGGVKDLSTVDFKNVSRPLIVERRTLLNKPMCVTLGLDGKVTFDVEVKPFVCAVKSNGHFGLVVISDDQEKDMKKKKEEENIGRWRSIVGGLVGSLTVGLVFLGFVVVAVVVVVAARRRRVKREEIERKEYEEEALRVVTMVGHSRAFVACSTRTCPSFMEHDCVPN
ncbi:unnamed protein product [Cochlearia groenlandica]